MLYFIPLMVATLLDGDAMDDVVYDVPAEPCHLLDEGIDWRPNVCGHEWRADHVGYPSLFRCWRAPGHSGRHKCGSVVLDEQTWMDGGPGAACDVPSRPARPQAHRPARGFDFPRRDDPADPTR